MLKNRKEAIWIKKRNAQQSDCSICLQSLQKNPDRDKQKQSGVIFRLVCKHEYHNLCISMWFDKHLSCPLCRQSVPYYSGLDALAFQGNYIIVETFDEYTSVEYTDRIKDIRQNVNQQTTPKN